MNLLAHYDKWNIRLDILGTEIKNNNNNCFIIIKGINSLGKELEVFSLFSLP